MTAFRPGQSPPPLRTPTRTGRTYCWRMTRALTAFAIAVAAAGLTGCGANSEDTRIPGHTLTIYSSLPVHGVSASTARAVAAGENLALREAGSHAAHRRGRLGGGA